MERTTGTGEGNGWIGLAVENINRKREKDKAAGKKVSRKKMTRSSYVRMCTLDKIGKYRPPNRREGDTSSQSE